MQQVAFRNREEWQARLELTPTQCGSR
jgi:hypothetical protein